MAENGDNQAAAPQVVEAPTISGPWAQDLETLFQDPQVRSTVDTFLRQKIQPRMTQLEQTIASTENAKALWDAFQDDPAAAYAAVTNELYGEEAAKAALEALQQRLQNAEQQPPEQPPEQPPASAAQASASDPRLDEMYEAWKRDQELKAYDAEIEKIVSDPENADINPNLLHAFVAAADGDFEQAVVMYRAAATDLLKQHGVDPTAPRQEAPPVVGNAGGGAPSSTPTQPEYRGTEGLHKAIEDTVAAMKRNSEAPPVG